MSVKDIGYFEPMCPSSSAVSIGSGDVADRQIIERAGGGMQSAFGNMQVTGGGLQVTMAEQQLNAAQIGACVEQVGGKGMPQHMWTERLDHAQLAAQILADYADAAWHASVDWADPRETASSWACATASRCGATATIWARA